MHPQLSLAKEHKACAEISQLLVECHRTSVYSKFFGACNDLKAQLDRCLASQYAEARKANAQRAKEGRRRTQERWRELDE